VAADHGTNVIPFDDLYDLQYHAFLNSQSVIVHFTDEGSRALAKQRTEHIQNALN
jgi:hypothetical protein